MSHCADASVSAIVTSPAKRARSRAALSSCTPPKDRPANNAAYCRDGYAGGQLGGGCAGGFCCSSNNGPSAIARRQDQCDHFPRFRQRSILVKCFFSPPSSPTPVTALLYVYICVYRQAQGTKHLPHAHMHTHTCTHTYVCTYARTRVQGDPRAPQRRQPQQRGV